MESLAGSVKRTSIVKFLWGYRDIFPNDIYATKEDTYHNLRGMI